jgi:C-terminal processing protease CtpA/Prc
VVQAYVDAALTYMDDGYFANTESWRNARRDAQAELAGAQSIDDTYDVLADLVVIAGGNHSRFLKPDEASAASGQYSANDDSWKPSVTVVDGVGRLTLPAYGSSDSALDRQYIATANTQILAADVSCGWMVNVSGNTGGDLFVMLAAAAPLLQDGPVMEFVDRDDNREELELDGGRVLLEGEVIVSADDPSKVGPAPIAIVQSRATASAGEGVVLAFHGQPEVRSFGQDTAGFSSANSSKKLGDGAMIILTESVFADRSGREFGGPIQPDVPISLNNSHQNSETPVSWLRNQC